MQQACLLPLALGFALAGTASSQTLSRTYLGDRADGLLGGNFDFIGDVNGDGLSDFVAGFPQDDTAGADRGRVAVYSGADGAVLYEHFADADGEQIGESVSAAGDVDADGVPDYLTGSTTEYGERGAVRLYSGATGTLLHYQRGETKGAHFGFSVSGAGDVDADGHADYVVGEPRWTPAPGQEWIGRIVVYSGATGHVLYSIDNGDEVEAYTRFGYRVSWLGDVDGDGHDDLIAASEIDALPCSSTECGVGYVALHSGADGSRIRSYEGFVDSHTLYGDRVGFDVAGAGDVDGDGLDDYLLGYDPILLTNCPQIRLYSGSGELLRTMASGGCAQQKGTSPWSRIVNLGDVNGDGVDDLVMGIDPFDSAKVFSGADGSTLQVIPGSADEGLRHGFAACGDLDGDGRADVAVGLPFADDAFADGGKVEIWSANPCGPAELYCEGTPNSVGDGARIRYAGSTSLSANDLSLGGDGCPPGQFGLFFYGSSEIQVPFGDGYLCVGAGATGIFRFNPPTAADAAGSFERPVDLTLPPAGSGAGQIHAGSTWSFQLWYRDPAAGGAGFNLSDGLTATFCF